MTTSHVLSQDELMGILERHRRWADTGGASGERADLRNLTLVGRSLWRADLRDALLDGSDLSGADLDHADLRGASLAGARLSGASLWEARMGGANLARAVLTNAKLDHADLRGADLTGADVDGVSMTKTLLDEPESLDAHRGMAAQKATAERRMAEEVAADTAARRDRQERLEAALTSGPARDWLQVAEKAQYLIALFAQTAEGQDPRHQRLIAGTLADLARLTLKPPPEEDDEAD